MSTETNNRSVSFSKVARTVAEQIKCPIPIAQLINAYHELYYKIRKSYNCDKDKTLFKKKLDNFNLRASSLFEVAACKSIITVNCTCKKKPDACECAILINCTCEKTENSWLRVEVYFSSKELRLGKIGSLDIK